MDEEDQTLYLIPEAVRQAVTSYAAKSGERFPANSTRALSDILEREHILARKSESRNRNLVYPNSLGSQVRNEVSVWAENRSHWCWAIKVETLYPNEPSDEDADPFADEISLLTEVITTFNGQVIESPHQKLQQRLDM